MSSIARAVPEDPGPPDPSRRPTAVVTGGSAGIGAATVRRLAAEGYRVITGARRLQRLERLTAASEQVVALELDVTRPESVERFVAASGLSCLELLVNNAGAALGLEPISDAVEKKWRDMFELNVMGVLAMTKAFLPALEASGNGHVVNVGSIAGFETYAGGAGYTASKHALRALTRTLRLELLGKPIRVTEVAPGLVDTEFSTVRFDGDTERARDVYRGMEPLSGDDIADCIAWAASRPPHVNIDEIVVRPRAQATATAVHRAPASGSGAPSEE
ncbi:MAG: SDR family NAD(P)-dependent oxidoreductase, partial [Holophagales bacterium]|nr:SDR family NAD(P)-dependent oxidoreductase [Holophagales bacterium]